MAENLLCTLFWAIWFVRITSWIHTSLLLCLLISPFSFRSTQLLSSLDLSPAVWFLCLSPVLDPKDFPLPDPPFFGGQSGCDLSVSVEMSLEGSATASCPKNGENNAVLYPGCPGVLCRSLSPVLDQCLVKTKATSGGKGHGWRVREVFGLNLVCMEAAKAGEWLKSCLEERPQGQGEVLFKNYVKNQSLAAPPASCGLHGGWISRTSDTYGRKGQFLQMAVVFLMFTHYRRRPILLRRRRDLNTEGKKMYEMNGWWAVSLLVKVLETARECFWTRTLTPLCYQNIRVLTSG